MPNIPTGVIIYIHLPQEWFCNIIQHGGIYIDTIRANDMRQAHLLLLVVLQIGLSLVFPIILWYIFHESYTYRRYGIRTVFRRLDDTDEVKTTL